MGELTWLNAIFILFFICGIFLIAGELIKWLFKIFKSLFGIKSKENEVKTKETEVKTKETEVKPNSKGAFLMSIGEEINKDIEKFKFPISFETIHEYFCLHILDGRALENGEMPYHLDFYNKKLLRYDPEHIKNAMFVVHRTEHLTDLVEGTNVIDERNENTPKALHYLSYYMVDIGKKNAIRTRLSEMRQIKQKHYDSIDKQAELISKMSADDSPEYDKADEKRRVILDKLILQFSELNININKLNEKYKKI